MKGRGALRFLRSGPRIVFALGLLGIMVLLALSAPLLAPAPPDRVDLEAIRLPPSRSHPFGTDEKGRDVFSRVLYGARFSLGIGALSTLLALGLGAGAGLIGGYCGGKADAVLQVVTDITLAFPSLLLAIAISVVLSPGFVTVFIALGLAGWASIARLVRGEVLGLREAGFVAAARASGASTVRILLRHILPNCAPLVLVAGSLKIGGFILGEAALSFLDLGVRPPAPAWGYMISAGREYLVSSSWITIFPGVFLALTVLSCNLLGDALRDRLDPGLKT